MTLTSSMEYISTRIVKPSAALIFLHGPGETGADAKKTFLKQLGARGHEYIKVYFPTASKRHMKAQDAATTFWFDGERNGPENSDIEWKIEDANGTVDLLEKWVKEIEATGISRTRIAIGGSSQGGAVSFYGVYSKGLKVGAVVTAASTIMFRNQAKYSTTSRIPLLTLYGKDDASISEETMKSEWKAMRELRLNYTPRTVPNCDHTVNQECVELIFEWLEMKIPLTDV